MDEPKYNVSDMKREINRTIRDGHEAKVSYKYADQYGWADTAHQLWIIMLLFPYKVKIHRHVHCGGERDRVYYHSYALKDARDELYSERYLSIPHINLLDFLTFQYREDRGGKEQYEYDGDRRYFECELIDTPTIRITDSWFDVVNIYKISPREDHDKIVERWPNPYLPEDYSLIKAYVDKICIAREKSIEESRLDNFQLGGA